MSFPPQSDQPFRRKVQKSEITCHVPLTRVNGALPSPPPKGPAHAWWLSAHQVLAESVHWFGLQRCANDFCNFLQDCSWHLPRAQLPCATGPQPAPSSYRCPGTSNEYSPVPIGPAVRAPEAKMLGLTHRSKNTDRHRPAYFFSSDPPEEISLEEISMLTHWSLFSLRF